MTIRILCAGRPLAAHEQAWVEDYERRARKYARVEIVRIKEKSRPSAPQTASATWADIEARIPPQAFRVLLDSSGKDLSTEDLGRILTRAERSSKSNLVFIVGGSYGLPEEARKSANVLWSLSRLMLPHRIALLLVVEQIYRVLSVRAGSPYHHG
ncbi:MAG: 23S rRNA (pseudouridine(1915)-N(3))-methyltransferase RlmH [Pseudomonadota bacterium]